LGTIDLSDVFFRVAEFFQKPANIAVSLHCPCVTCQIRAVLRHGKISARRGFPTAQVFHIACRCTYFDKKIWFTELPNTAFHFDRNQIITQFNFFK
jgi:hypothetical protein